MKPPSSRITVAYALITPLGTFRAMYTEAGLCRLCWPDTDVASSADVNSSSAFCAKTRTWHTQLQHSISQYFLGFETVFHVPVDFTSGTLFQKQIWRTLHAVPWGAVVTYAELAMRAGFPGAARAVGGACAKNPVPIVVPCHRVLPSSGRLGGFSGPAGWKARLLALEGLSYV